jgi:uncharacterized protein (DUF1800 family)
MAVTKTARTHTGISTYAGTWGRDEVIHLLNRVHFGAKLEDVEYFSKKTLSQTIDEILDVDYTPPSPPINDYNGRIVDPLIPAGSTWVDDYNAALNGQRRNSFKRWWVGQMINQDRTIREKMVLFWHNHFATEMQVYSWANFAYKHNAMLRKDCLKDFRTLVKDVTLDPAMLIYLNGERNTNTAPDENYSRELQELFTLGKGPESKYTEADVIEAAKILTGWRINKRNGEVFFVPNRHDTSDKTFSAFYDHTVVYGKTGTAGEEELDDLLTMIFRQNEVANFMVRKLYRWFVYYDIDEATEENVIKPLADIFRNNSYEIKPVLEALFKSEHFFDLANRGALIKSPVDFVVGINRLYNLEYPQASDYNALYGAWGVNVSLLSILQQDIGDPPSVAGWAAYYQIPQYHQLWINSDTLPKRNQITDIMVVSGYRAGSDRLQINPLTFAEKFSRVANPSDFIDDLVQHMFTLDVSAEQKEYMRSILLSGQVQDYHWTDAWNAYINDKNDTMKQNVVGVRLIMLFKYLMNLSEFQLS